MIHTQRIERINPLLDTGCFRAVYMVSMLLGTFAFINNISYYFNALLFVWGSLLFVYHYIIKRQMKRLPMAKYAVAFLIFGVITAFLRCTLGWQGFVLNIGYMLFCAFYFFLFYGMYGEQTSRVKKEIFRTIELLLCISTLFIIIGLVMLCIFRNTLCIFDQHLLIFDNRYKGVFVNANHCGFVSFTAIVFCAILYCSGYLKSQQLRAPKKVLLIISALLHLVSMLLSASNAALLLALATLTVLSAYYCFAGIDLKQLKSVAKRAIAFAACLVAICSLVLVRTAISELCEIDTPPSSTIIGGDVIEDIDEIAGDTTKDGSITFSHVNPNFDSGRMRLYSKALNYVIKAPIFGTGSGNVLYAEYLNSNGKIVDFHNGYLSILVGNGLVGLLLFVIFGFRVAERMTLRLFGSKRLKLHPLPIMFSYLCGYCIYAAVEPSMLYNPYYSIAVFWFILGSACLLQKDSFGVDDLAAYDEVREIYKIEPKA